MAKRKKYSIILPVYNGAKYLPTCVNTIIKQSYNDYELIISNDGSTDGTGKYLDTLIDNPNIKIVQPEERLSMTEHWEWALSHATGEWMIFVGQDDGLQHYFFELADVLTNIASKKNIRAITSSRAYYFWKGCEYIYGDIAIKYRATQKLEILNTKYGALKALLGFQRYFELPQMYTNSIFHRSLINEAKSKQDGKLFSCHPQDANLAAISCSIEKQYLKSYIPLGWIGSSPKSAGMAIISDENKINPEDKEGLKNLKKEYEDKVSKSKLKYHELAGNFSLGSHQIYFWQALLKTNILRSDKINKFLILKLFKYILMATSVNEVKKLKKRESLIMMKEMIEKNRLNYSLILVNSYLIKLFDYSFYALKGFKKILRIIFYKNISLKILRKENNIIDLIENSKEINVKIKNSKILNSLKINS